MINHFILLIFNLFKNYLFNNFFLERINILIKYHIIINAINLIFAFTIIL